jgi:cytochrome c oxidase cbb3-type subunit 3
MSSRCLERCGFALLAVLALAGCKREVRPPPSAPASAVPGQPYAPGDAGPIARRYEENATAVSQGMTWYRTYNCNGCHAAGGGNIGPSLMDAAWRYGADPSSIYATIANGRPNGMPAFGAHVPEDQIWQLVAYVRSLSGQVHEDVAPTRGDTLQAARPVSRREQEMPVREAAPAEPSR